MTSSWFTELKKKVVVYIMFIIYAMFNYEMLGCDLVDLYEISTSQMTMELFPFT